MRSSYEFAKQILNGEIPWSDVPAHLLEKTREIYAKLKISKDEKYINTNHSMYMKGLHPAILDDLTRRMKK